MTSWRRRGVLGAGLAAALLLAAALRLGAGSGAPGAEGRGEPAALAGDPGAPEGSPAEEVGPAPLATSFPAPSPATGWEEAAGVVAADLRRLLDGRARAGAYEEARAEAARRDLALFPPDRGALARLLAGSERERVLALAVLAARPERDDDLVRLVLRSQRPDDDDVVRLLGAEIAAGLGPDVLARHEEDLLRAFEREPNPLVLAVAMPALERMDESRLRTLLRAQAATARAEMLPVLLALARDRLAAAAVEDLEPSLSASLSGPGGR